MEKQLELKDFDWSTLEWDELDDKQKKAYSIAEGKFWFH